MGVPVRNAQGDPKVTLAFHRNGSATGGRISARAKIW
jgi:hypothetical protein